MLLCRQPVEIKLVCAGKGIIAVPAQKEVAMETLHITDIISLLGLPYPLQGQASYYVRCPCCDEDSRKKHLNINLKKDVFRCPRCGVSGGILDLYSLYTNIPRERAFNAIREKLGRPEWTVHPKIKIEPVKNVQSECPITDIETRHATYSALLSKLSLARDHKENLLNRGLTEQDIVRLGYKTTPIACMTGIAKRLQSDGCYLAGIPGFYRTETDGWTFVHESRGILIPVRNRHGQIQGLQIRRDNVEKRKFRWVSSTDRKDGCKTEAWVHIAGAVSQEMILTEGPMKADVIHTLTGLSVLAIPGVNSLTHLQTVLEDLKKEGLRKINTAFDMDFSTNCYVQNGFNNLLSLLVEMGFRFGSYVWDPRYKGLDDYIWAQKQMGQGGGTVSS